MECPSSLKVEAHFLHTERKMSFKEIAKHLVEKYPEMDLKLSALDVSIMWQSVEKAKETPKKPSYIYRTKFVAHTQNGKPIKTKKAPQKGKPLKTNKQYKTLLDACTDNKEKPVKTAATNEQLQALLNKCW
ncbi:hypothetical protein TH2_015 [Shewanella phage Thanatos-2]|nr:hypothetical protein TH2_015 [Shewanella phage Thanatos-2]